ncbi:TPA: hypothetical protein HA251_06770 [Candidatus Woesearchaeota archaeon]|nr:hypothetical protein [Candidatus Woesearchaeota archaeon]
MNDCNMIGRKMNNGRMKAGRDGKMNSAPQSGQRRAQHPVNFILEMVVMVIVILALVMLFIALRDTTDSAEKDAVCAAQIVAHSTAIRASGGIADLPIVCPTKYSVIDGESGARKKIAAEMKRCWGMWGKGRIPLFGDKEGAYCHICSMITVEGAPQVTGLPEYLRTTKATANETYLEYLAGAKTGEEFEGDAFKEGAQPIIGTTAPVAVIFYYAKGYSFMEGVTNTISKNPALGGMGMLVGVVGGPVLMPLTAAGGVALAAVTPREKGSTMSFIAVRPLEASQLTTLGCQYVPVRNE